MCGLACRISVDSSGGLGSTRTCRVRREEGQTFVEYAMTLALVVVALAAAITFLRDKLDAFYTQIANDFAAATS